MSRQKGSKLSEQHKKRISNSNKGKHAKFTYKKCKTCGKYFEQRAPSGCRQKNQIFCSKKCVSRTEEWLKK